MRSDLYNQKGERIGEIELPDKIFGIPLDSDLLHQTVLYYENLSRQPIAKVKDRSEVRGGGRKPWRQKGTGRARHGSIRSPLWRGGGVVFGPTPEKKYQQKMPKKMRRKALFITFSQKLKDDEVIVLDKIEVKEPKTKKVMEIFKNLLKIKKDIKDKKTIFILYEKNENFLKGARNIKNLSTVAIRSINPYLLLKNKYAIVEKDAINYLKTHTKI